MTTMSVSVEHLLPTDGFLRWRPSRPSSETFGPKEFRMAKFVQGLLTLAARPQGQTTVSDDNPFRSPPILDVYKIVDIRLNLR